MTIYMINVKQLIPTLKKAAFHFSLHEFVLHNGAKPLFSVTADLS